MNLHFPHERSWAFPASWIHQPSQRRKNTEPLRDKFLLPEFGPEIILLRVAARSEG